MNQQVSWQDRWQAVIHKLRIVLDQEEEQQLLVELAQSSSAKVVGFVNAHAMNSIAENTGFFDALMKADVLLRDGSGMALLYRYRGLVHGNNMNGTDLIPKIIAAFKGRRVAFWGTEEPYLTAAAERSAETFGVQVASCHHGFEEPERYLQLANEIRPDLIVLGMGMPKQERVAALIREAGLPVVVVCGGAILDFLGKKVQRAPQWIRKLGFEWLYRLLLEPKRLFKRYVIGNPAFMLRLALWR